MSAFPPVSKEMWSVLFFTMDDVGSDIVRSMKFICLLYPDSLYKLLCTCSRSLRLALLMRSSPMADEPAIQVDKQSEPQHTHDIATCDIEQPVIAFQQA